MFRKIICFILLSTKILSGQKDSSSSTRVTARMSILAIQDWPFSSLQGVLEYKIAKKHSIFGGFNYMLVPKVINEKNQGDYLAEVDITSPIPSNRYYYSDLTYLNQRIEKLKPVLGYRYLINSTKNRIQLYVETSFQGFSYRMNKNYDTIFEARSITRAYANTTGVSARVSLLKNWYLQPNFGICLSYIDERDLILNSRKKYIPKYVLIWGFGLGYNF